MEHPSFERLLLSLSTHALFTCTSGQKHVPIDVALGSTPVRFAYLCRPPMIPNAFPLVKDIFRVQSQAYTTLLASSQSTQYSWERSASLLQQRLDDLTLLRVRPFLAFVENNKIYNILESSRIISPLTSPWHRPNMKHSPQTNC